MAMQIGRRGMIGRPYSAKPGERAPCRHRVHFGVPGRRQHHPHDECHGFLGVVAAVSGLKDPGGE